MKSVRPTMENDSWANRNRIVENIQEIALRIESNAPISEDLFFWDSSAYKKEIISMLKKLDTLSNKFSKEVEKIIGECK